ncbi:MAG: thiamine biosynthesis protein ApbE [Flavobacteriaceae bacterium]|nr:thiamine biosynthesis protein ApbE [Flavobacteriaceae bacterium]|tara:strand:- start:84831 stop:85808 length:978 start_codon:yes stop_codon:yes gene_type:complete
MKKTLLFIAIIAIFVGCSEDTSRRVDLAGSVFGTTYKITYLDTDINYQKELDSLFEMTNNSVSTYIPNSIISKVNRGENVPIDTIFSEVLQKSKRIYKETNGFFDPTVGSLVNAYGFGPANSKINLTQKQIDSIMPFVGLDKVRAEGAIIQKEHPNIYLDFNSIAKGSGIDIVARFFDAKGINNYLIEIGGEIRTKGVKGEGKPWVIQVVNPVDADNSGGFKKINLSNKSMATSGNYRKFRVSDNGTKYVHTINPKTGKAEESNLLSASIIGTSDCADVDAYATAIMAMGLEKAKEFLDKRSDLEVILIYTDEKNQLQEYTNLKN